MAREKGSVTRAEMDGKAVWVKRYGSQSRQLRLAAMRRVVNRLGVPALLPPPHHVGDAARATEQRRLLQLRAAGVNVPPVVGSGPGVLILGDLGPTLATSLRSAHTGEAEALFSGAAWALASAQRRGGYIGQPQARNITIDAQRNFGFLDFEEDPGEVMSLDQAQTRDWLVFAAGAAHHLPFCDRRMGELIAPALEVTSDDVKEGLDASPAETGVPPASDAGIRLTRGRAGQSGHGIAARTGRRKGLASDAVGGVGGVLGHGFPP